MSKNKYKVFVSGCCDLLHFGHVAFLKEASEYGKVHIGLGADQTIRELKGREPVNSEAERLYTLSALACVDKVTVNSGRGLLDFLPDIKKIKPDIFLVVLSFTQKPNYNFGGNLRGVPRLLIFLVGH